MRIDQADKSATADEATYFVADARIELIGSPKAFSGKNELATKIADVHAQCVRLRLVRCSPDLSQQLTMREHLAGMGCERAQQIILSGCQMNLLIVNSHHPMHPIDLERTEAKRRLLLPRGWRRVPQRSAASPHA